MERKFCEIVSEAAGQYTRAANDGANELKLSQIRLERDQKLRQLNLGDEVQGWVGTVDALSTSRDGRAHVALRLPCPAEVILGTWNNAVSDAGDRTMLLPDGAPYKFLADAKQGQTVYFSGMLLRRAGGLRDTSLTEKGEVVRPYFLIHFNEIVSDRLQVRAGQVVCTSITDPMTSTRPAAIRGVLVKACRPANATWGPYKVKVGESVVGDIPTDFVNLIGHWKFGQYEVVLLGATCAGSGCGEETYAFVVEGPDRSVKMISHPNFTSYRVAHADVEGGMLTLDLGYEAKRRKKVLFDGKAVTISFEDPNLTQAPEPDCKQLYEHGLGGCAWSNEPQPNPARCKTMGFLSNADNKWLDTVERQPGYNKDSYERFCKQACVELKPATYDDFRREVCNIESGTR